MIGCVELHVQLYDEFVEDIWLKKVEGEKFVCEEPITVQSEGYEYATLAPTDHMLFLILHLVKHFIMAGMSLRMMTDVVLFFVKNASHIDHKRIWNTIRLGSNDKQAGEESGNEYNRQMITGEKGEQAYLLHMVYLEISRAVFALFPPFKVLANQYPFLKNKPILMPWAWAKYVVYLLKQAAQRKFLTRGIARDESNISSAGSERIELFTKFGML